MTSSVLRLIQLGFHFWTPIMLLHANKMLRRCVRGWNMETNLHYRQQLHNFSHWKHCVNLL